MSVAFVLSGGGARCAFQVGVMRQLIDSGITPDVIYGTSGGGLNALGMCFGDIETLTNMWLEITKMSDIFKKQWIYSFFNKGYYNLDPLRNTLIKYYIENGKQNNCKAFVHSVDLISGKVVVTDNGNIDNFIDMVIAGSSIPSLVHPFKDRYVDGGVRENIPVKSAFLGKHEEVYIISAQSSDSVGNDYKIRWPYKSNILFRSADIVLQERSKDDLNGIKWKSRKLDVLKIFIPDSLKMSLVDFNPAKIREAIQTGYETKESNIEEVLSKNDFVVNSEEIL